MKKKFILPLVLLVLILAIGGAGLYILKKYSITNIYVEGNTHYTDDQIVDLVMETRLDHNSFFLSRKYKHKETPDIPFVEMMEIKVLAPDTVKIMVYEKSLAGYVEFLGKYLYFDKDGIVVESSSSKTNGIPLVSGLAFDYVQLYEPLPVEKPEVFTKILDITKLLSKYKLAADRIAFDRDLNMTIHFGNVRVLLGDGKSIDEKITRLQYVLPEVLGLSGVLDMKNFSGEEDTVTFIRDKE